MMKKFFFLPSAQRERREGSPLGPPRGGTRLSPVSNKRPRGIGVRGERTDVDRSQGSYMTKDQKRSLVKISLLALTWNKEK